MKSERFLYVSFTWLKVFFVSQLKNDNMDAGVATYTIRFFDDYLSLLCTYVLPFFHENPGQRI